MGHDDIMVDDEKVAETVGALRAAIAEVGASGEGGLFVAIDDIQDCPITVEDGIAIVFQTIEDTGSTNPTDDAWNGYDADEEGVYNHALYHQGRPGECGVDCPAL